jgi:hypothetical protein
MSDDQQPVIESPEGGDEPKQQQPDPTVIAREKGWKPKEEYEGDLSNWVDADEFVKRQPLFDKIRNQSKKLKELEKTIEAISQHYNENIKQAKERAIAELKAERKEAIELGEAARVDAIDQRIEQVKKVEEPPKHQALPQEIESFIEANKDWWEKDEDMTFFAMAHNEKYLRKYPGKLEESLKATMEAVKNAYPEKFANQKRNAPPSVEGSTPPTSGGGKYSTARLNHEQKLVYEQLVKRSKVLTHDQYFKDLESAGFLD